MFLAESFAVVALRHGDSLLSLSASDMRRVLFQSTGQALKKICPAGRA